MPVETNPVERVPTPHLNPGNGKGKQREVPPPLFDDPNNGSNSY